MAMTEGEPRRLSVQRLSTIVLALGLAWWAADTLYATRFWDRVAPRGAVCQGVAGLRGAEDAVVTQSGLVLASLDDRQASAGPGRLVLLARADKPASLLWDGAGRPFHPHGLDYRVEGGRELVYVVNHLPENDAVMVFQLQGQRLQLLRQIDYPGHGLNDLAVVGEGRFYATVDHIPSSTLLNRLGDYLRLPLGAVEYFDGQKFQRVATGIRFANGIAAAADGQHLYVAAMLASKIQVFARDAGGGLTWRAAISVPGFPDNLSWMGSDVLLVAAHPRILDLAKQQRRRAEKAPSRVLQLRLAGKGRSAQIEEFMADDGQGIASASVAVWAGQSLWIGSVFDQKMLVCSLDGGSAEVQREALP